MCILIIVINVCGYLRVRYPRLVNVYTDYCYCCLRIPEGKVSKVSSYTCCLLSLVLLCKYCLLLAASLVT